MCDSGPSSCSVNCFIEDLLRPTAMYSDDTARKPLLWLFLMPKLFSLEDLTCMLRVTNS